MNIHSDNLGRRLYINFTGNLSINISRKKSNKRLLFIIKTHFICNETVIVEIKIKGKLFFSNIFHWIIFVENGNFKD